MNIPTGLTNKLELTVGKKHTAAYYGSGLLEVFATPVMIGLMEETAQRSIQPYLPEGHMTVGIEINTKHIKATLIGMKIFCESKLTKVDDKTLYFEIHAWDDKGDIGFAKHTRYVVNVKKFMEKLNNQ